MDKDLFIMFEEEIFNEAKRIVPLVYDENELMKFKKEYKNYINEKYMAFYIDIEIYLLGLCGMKYEGKDWVNDKIDHKKSIEHHKMVLEYDKETFNANVDETINNIAKDIVNNYDEYESKSLFEIMPKLVSKYMKTHNDSVEHKAYILFLNNSLKKFGKYLPTTKLSDLVNI